MADSLGGRSASDCPHLQARQEVDAHREKRQIAFDPVAQHVDVSGVYAWKAPGKTDQRGPCPGLNALANHGLPTL